MQVRRGAVLTCQPLFSAALIAYVECHVDDAGQKGALCKTLTSPRWSGPQARLPHGCQA